MGSCRVRQKQAASHLDQLSTGASRYQIELLHLWPGASNDMEEQKNDSNENTSVTRL